HLYFIFLQKDNILEPLLKGTLLREDIFASIAETGICATALQESTFSSFWFWMGLGEEQAQSKKIFQSLFMFQFQVYLLMNKEAKGYKHKEDVAYDAAKEISLYLSNLGYRLDEDEKIRYKGENLLEKIWLELKIEL
ncbi:hypothetical protein ACJX0J_015976, partial [Zea mays]